MTFEVPDSKRSIAQNRFEFKVPGDRKKYSIPKAKYMTAGQIEAMSTKGTELTILDLLALFGPAEDAAAVAVRTLDAEQLKALMTAWQEDSKVGVGESQASS